MFRRLSNSLPQDPKIPSDLAALGYFVNEQDQIRQTKQPDQRYLYQFNKNERVNEVHKEAMNSKSSKLFFATCFSTNPHGASSLHSLTCP